MTAKIPAPSHPKVRTPNVAGSHSPLLKKGHQAELRPEVKLN